MPTLLLTPLASLLATQLAQPNAGSQSDPGKLFAWLGALIGALVLLTAVILFLRRRLLAGDDPAANSVGLMEGLRLARERGEITAEEYQRARERLGGRLAQEMRGPARPAAPSTPQRPHDGYSTGRPDPGPETRPPATPPRPPRPPGADSGGGRR